MWYGLRSDLLFSVDSILIRIFHRWFLFWISMYCNMNRWWVCYLWRQHQNHYSVTPGKNIMQLVILILVFSLHVVCICLYTFQTGHFVLEVTKVILRWNCFHTSHKVRAYFTFGLVVTEQVCKFMGIFLAKQCLSLKILLQD